MHESALAQPLLQHCCSYRLADAGSKHINQGMNRKRKTSMQRCTRLRDYPPVYLTTGPATTHFLQRTGKGQEALLVLSQGTKNYEELTASGKELFASSVNEMAYFVQSARYDSGAFENEKKTTFNGIDGILFDGQFEFSTSDNSATYQGYGVFLDAEAGPVLISAIDCSEGQTQGDELQIMVKDVASSITDLGVPKTE